MGLLGLLVAAAFALHPPSRIAFGSLPLLAAFETGAALAALLAVVLVWKHAVRTGRRRDALVVFGLATLAVGRLEFSALPTALSQETDFIVWAQALTGLIGATVLAVACGLPQRWLPPAPRHLGRAAATFVVPAHVVVITASILLARWVEPGVDFAVSPVDQELFRAHALLLIVQAVAACGFAIAAVAGTVRATREQDTMLGWYGAASALACGSSVTYVMLPAISSSWVSSGDLLRIGFYVLLVMGGSFEISAEYRRQTRSAVDGERRRIARELHDGLAQDLALITMAAGHMDKTSDGAHAQLPIIHQAAQRAMTESRALLEMLIDPAASTPPGDPTPCRLAPLVEEVAALNGIQGTIDIDPRVRMDEATQTELGRIVTEAITNAARHGQATQVQVRLRLRRGVPVLTVSDDGIGFDVPASVEPGHFGLTSMRQRALGLGAALRIDSAKGRGTTVEVVLA